MRRSVLALLSLAALTGTAAANGRPAGTSTINFRQGSPDHVIAGMTFGFLRSDDGGVTWKWMCEKAINYGGTFDPDYAYTASGAIFATTFDGLQVVRDSCSFTAAPPGNTFVSAVQLGPNGDLYYAAADPNDGKIYKSTDDGMTFPVMGSPGANNDWWDSIVVAPSDPNRVYLTGYHYIKRCSNNATTVCVNAGDCGGAPNTCDSIKVQLLFRSDNGGQTYTPMTQTGLTMSNLSTLDVVGVDSALKDTVYLHVSIENGTVGDSVYKSTNGGASWTKIVTTTDTFGQVFLARSNGDLIVSTLTQGSQKSTNGGATWTPLVGAPHINCLVENPGDHTVWACTHNFDSPGISMDGFGIMKSTDLATWTGVLRYQDINGVVACDAATTQATQCVGSYEGKPSVWCCLEQQLGITDTSVACTGAASCDVVPDGGNDAGNTNVHPPKQGCCNAGDSGSGAALLALGAGALIWRRKKR
ncbi:MAG: sialidase family protein [Kofleriaceae bacterium]